MGISMFVIFLGYLFIGVVMLFTADIGTEHGLSFAVYLRAPFGIYGTHLPSISRGIVAAIWFGIQTYLGALALNGISQYLFSFDNWFVWYLIFAAVQVFNTALGIRAVEKFADYAAPILIAISIWMYYFLDDLATTNGHNIWSFIGQENTPLFLIFIANFSLWSALAVDIPNITRYLKVEAGTKSFFRRNKNVFVAQLVALPLVSMFMAFIGAIAFVATGDWNPITIIQDTETGITSIVLLALILLAQWSTNNAANLIPAALSFVNAAPKYINYKWGVVIAGIVGTIAMPWLILNNLFTFLGYYGGALSAVAGIMVCDYYFIRRRRLNVPDLFRTKGQYTYAGGFNYAGLISWIIAGSLAIWQLQQAYLVGFPVGFILYYILMKAWILPQYAQAEIKSGYASDYLATSVGKEWAYSNDHFTREDIFTTSSKVHSDITLNN
ncbi:MAG: NCS1 family transporter [Bacilli bacterium]